MTPEEYAAAQLAISAAVARYVESFAQFIVAAGQSLSLANWGKSLELLFPAVQQGRWDSAVLGRKFYDDQRARHFPDLPRHDRFIENYEFSDFVFDMEPVRRDLMEMRSSRDAVEHIALRAVRSVENGARRQIIQAVESDTDLADELSEEDLRKKSRRVQGWARVATGRETCAWCLMLISRGPVYMDAVTAGLDLDHLSAVEMHLNGEDISDYMEQWHTGCDCKVVPVFKNEDWAGKAAYLKAEKLWIEATNEAKKLREEEPDRVYTAGKNKGKPITLNDDVINALRRKLSRGEIKPEDFAFVA
ncbi:VG15 protein [Mycobacteroides abscessus]|uniref:VG15 protein n=1 Tax=Mycobacteroides abscessus TaxID=36809 RepID=UPI0009278224|nr:hypothetical protein [Mycobacteroides abscessus]SIC87569.1 Uncharacterised protein [Mycobacteroides abscessus subsp. bolletii]SKT75757.1 Uncharacterised protein [Mycobacteroides abscessus subsp. bolletii]SLD35577.1 Uncharacterised protein [Mycobacteroides abscessus subsp. bolletii]SLF79235.1 Uncharacterised protein [Mycobacteroides abscessus subsp. bolletii]